MSGPQFLIGMAVDLFVEIPKDHPGARPWECFSGAARSVAWERTRTAIEAPRKLREAVIGPNLR